MFNLQNGVLAITGTAASPRSTTSPTASSACQPRRGRSGRPFTEVLQGCPEVARVLLSAFETDDLPNRAEMRLRKTGRAIGYTLSRIHDDEGRQVGATLFFKDLTRVEQIEERERLRDRLATLGEMAAAIAHEVKNPLASIEVMAGVLKRQLARPRRSARDARRHHQGSARWPTPSSSRCSSSSGRFSCRSNAWRSRDVFKESITLAEGKMPRGTIQIDTIDRSGRAGAAGRPAPAAPAVHRICWPMPSTRSAARAASRFGRALEPGEDEPRGRGDPLPPQVVIEVRDNGPGIAADDLERIFSPFFTTKPQGTGLGLAIVRKVVDAHDGRIDAMSAPGRGAPSASRCRWCRPAGIHREISDGTHSRR